MSEAAAIVTVQWHRRYLRRYIRLHIGAPDGFTCRGGWHEAIVDIGDFPGSGAGVIAPPRIDRRWPLYCDGCSYRFTERDHYQIVATPLHDVPSE